jgi:CRP-like cAMP-binding protein
VTYQAGETVIVDGSKTGRLLILRKGIVAIVKEDTKIAKVAEPGAVFGEPSILLDQPHTADVRALETSQFHVADAAVLLAQNPIAVLYVATVLAHRLDGANHALIQLKNQLQTGLRATWSSKRSARWKDFSPSAAPALFMPDIHSIRSHNLTLMWERASRKTLFSFVSLLHRAAAIAQDGSTEIQRYDA